MVIIPFNTRFKNLMKEMYMLLSLYVINKELLICVSFVIYVKKKKSNTIFRNGDIGNFIHLSSSVSSSSHS